MKPIIRECFIDDSFAIQQLNSLELGYDFPVEQTQQKLRELLASEKDKIFVAEVDGVFAGYVHANDYELLYAPPMKNVMGIAAGMLDGGGYGTLKGPLMARGAREVSRLIKAMGGNELSAYGLCHLGDYETTLFSEYSNNRKFGEAFVKKEKFSKLAEGASTAKAMKTLGEKYNVDLPITNAICSIIYENKDPMSVFLSVFSRSTRKEF